MWGAKMYVSYVSEPRHEITCLPDFRPGKTQTCLPDFRPGKTQTGLRSHINSVEAWKFGYRTRYYTIYAAKDKGADQTARMRRLICAFVVRICHKHVFPWRGSYYYEMKMNNFSWIPSWSRVCWNGLFCYWLRLCWRHMYL